MKKWLSVCLVLAMVLSLLPAPAMASGEVFVETTADRNLSAEVARSLTLAQGNHVRWIDRIANLPQYARNFYQWLENNATAEGALSNPAKGTLRNGSYVYVLHSFQASVGFSYSAGDDMMALAKQAALADMAPKAQVALDYGANLYSAFDRDHPEVFWLTGNSRMSYGYSYSYRITNGAAVASYTTTVYFYLKAADFDVRAADYRQPSAIAEAIEQRNADTRRILEDCPVDAPAAVQVAYLNRVLTQTNAYNPEVATGNSDAASDDAWRCISALAGTSGAGAPVCEGYARAFKVLCDALGVPCVLTEGQAKTEAAAAAGPHMWNYVQIDGSWYAVDVTWNDPYVSWDADNVLSGYEGEEWLLLGSETIVSEGLSYIDSHVVDNTVTEGGLAFVNGPVLNETAYEMPDNLMDVAPYRSEGAYTAPEKAGYLFAGWYTDAACTQPLSERTTSGYAYAKFVDENMLNIKWQVTAGTTAASESTNLRLLTSVDSLQYRQVFFAVDVGTKEQTWAGNQVYRSVRAGGRLITDPEKLFCSESRYFVTFSLTQLPASWFDREFSVTAGWKTPDGTVVSGNARNLRISEVFS